MPSVREQFLAAVKGRPGWENAEIDASTQEERSVTFRKDATSNSRVAIFSHRRMAHRGSDGTFTDIDTSWKTRNNHLAISVGDYTVSVGDQSGITFGTTGLIKYTSKQFSLSITPLQHLMWENGLGETRVVRSQASVPGALVEGRSDIIRFANAYGTGINYELVSEADRVFKRIFVPRKQTLGRHEVGEHLVLGNEIVVDANSKLRWFNENRGGWTDWDGVTEIVTFQPIRVTSLEGEYLYSFDVPFIQSSHETRGIGPRNREIAAGRQFDHQDELVAEYSWYKLWNDKGVIRLDSCFNPDIMPGQNISYYLDPTLDLDVTDPLSAEDNSYSGTRPNTGKNYVDCANFAGGKVRLISNWDISATLDGSESITSAVLSIYVGGVGAGWDSNIRMEDTPDSTFPTSGTEANTRYSNWNATTVNWDTGSTGRQDTSDFGALLESVISGGGSVGEIAIDVDPIGAAFETGTLYTYGYGPTFDLDLTIEYEAGGGGVVGPLVGGHLVKSGILQGRLVGRR